MTAKRAKFIPKEVKTVKEEKRILAVDFGERRIGLALSDPLGLTAQGMETWEPKDEEELILKIEEMVAEEGIKRIVVGLPLNMDGSRGPEALKVLKFVERLMEKVKKPVVTWDERLSTISAHRALNDMGRRTKGRKGEVDRLAATLILQAYLDSKENQR